MNRGKKVLVAGSLAIGFLLLRQLYAFLFNGLEGNGVVLSLPQLRLPRPFSHITLFGEISTEGILRNFELGLPMAISIFLIGSAAAFITQTHLLTASTKLPAFKNLLTSLAIGLAVMPALFDASKKVLSALRLRAESKRRILVPILERVVEIANALGLRLALDTHPTQGNSGIKVQGLKVDGLGLAPLNLEVKPGENVVLTGPTGSGKSSILEAVAGITGEYRGRKVNGEVLVGDKPLSRGLSALSSFIGFIPQNPRELCIGLTTKELLNVSSATWLDRLEISGLEAKDASDLSEGEIFKLVFASVISRSPSILVLDEPFGSLDVESREVVASILNEFVAAGGSVLLAEHEPAQIENLQATCLQLKDNQLVAGSYEPELPNPSRKVAVVGNEQVMNLQLPDLVRGRLLIGSPRVQLQQADCVWLAGENGSGKSSLLEELAGTANLGPSQIALVPENFDDFFVTGSLHDELVRADKIAGVPIGFTKTTLESILPSETLVDWSAIHPRDLSRGSRLALAIAMQLSHKPKVLLIDEPFRGLDPLAKDQVSETLRCVQETGCAILFASHEASWASSLATRKLEIQGQQLKVIASVSA